MAKVLNLTRKEALEMFAEMGYTTADKWNDERLARRCEDKDTLADEQPDEWETKQSEKLYKGLLKADKVKITGGSSKKEEEKTEAPPKTGKKTKKKAAKKTGKKEEEKTEAPPKKTKKKAAKKTGKKEEEKEEEKTEAPPKKTKKKAAKKKDASSKAASRVQCAMKVLKKLPKKGKNIDELIAAANDEYVKGGGSDNLGEAAFIMKRCMNVLEIWGAVETKGDSVCLAS